jgi:hypothetical protein
MRSSQRVLAEATFLVGLPLAVLAFALWPTKGVPQKPLPKIDKTSYTKIKIGIANGITLAEAEEIIGVPPGDYSDGGQPALLTLGPGSDSWASWVGREVAIIVLYEDAFAIFAVYALPVARPGDPAPPDHWGTKDGDLFPLGSSTRRRRLSVMKGRFHQNETITGN